MSKHDARLVVMLEHIEDSDSNSCSCGYGLTHWRLGDLKVCDQCLASLVRKMDEIRPNELCLN